MFASFTCTDPEELYDGCSVPFADYLPPLGDALPCCPHCGGPTVLHELLVPLAARAEVEAA